MTDIEMCVYDTERVERTTDINNLMGTSNGYL
jgi:hypothetical protein